MTDTWNTGSGLWGLIDAANPDWSDGYAPGSVPPSGGPVSEAVQIGSSTSSPTVTITGGVAGYAGGSLVNFGTIAIDADIPGHAVYPSGLLIIGTTTLTGGGVIAFSPTLEYGSNFLSGSGANALLDNVNNTLEGSGLIGYSGDFLATSLNLINESAGVIDATGSTISLEINGDTGNGKQGMTVTNNGLMEATGTDSNGLQINAVIVTQTGGGALDGAGGIVTLSNTTVIGGTLTTTGTGGLIEVLSASTFEGSAASPVTITTGSTVGIQSGASLDLAASSGANGSIVNHGTIEQLAGGYATDILIGSGAGGGTLALSGGGTVKIDSDITGGAINSIFDNVDNTIEGVGLIGDSGGYGTSPLTEIINEAAGVIDATGATTDLVIEGNTGNGAPSLTVVNDGLMESTGGDANGLVFDSVIVNQSGGGTIEGAGGNVTLSNATIIGGTLTTTGTVLIEVSGATSTLDGTGALPVTITTGSTVGVTSGDVLVLAASSGANGSIVNQGTIEQLAGGYATDISIGSGAGGGTVMLSGGGTVKMDSQIVAGAANTTLDNVNDTIEGSGTIVGGDGLTVDNAGTIDATNSAAELVASNVPLSNTGMARAQNGATLSFSNSLTNIVADLNHTGGDELTGGTYDVIDAATGSSVIAISGGVAAKITTLDATVNLAGATSKLTSNGVALSSSLLEVASGGALNLYYGFNSGTQQVFNDSANPLEIAGYVGLNGAALDPSIITIDNGGTLAGDGEFNGSAAENAIVTGPIVNNGSIVDYGVLSGSQEPTFEVNGAVTGIGAIQLNGDSTLELTGAVGSGQTTTFENSETTGLETLQIDSSSIGPSGAFASPIAGFKMGDAIDLTNLSGESGYSFTGGVLTVNFTGAPSASFAMQGLGTDTQFSFNPFGTSGTRITIGMSEMLADDTGASSTDGITNNPALTGSADAGATIYLYQGGNLLGTTLASTTTAEWNFTPTGLPDGVHTIVADEENAAGDVVGPSSLTFTLKTSTTEGPISDSAVTAGTNGVDYINATNFNGGDTTLTGTAEAGDSIVVTNGGNVVGSTVATGGNWSVVVDGLQNGTSYNYVATATDIAGNTAQSAPFAFTVKTTTTESAISDNAVTVGTDGNDYINAAHFDGGDTTLTGTAETGDAIVVTNGGNVVGTATATGGAWSVLLTGLQNGTAYNLVATATDAAGNTAQSQPFDFTVDDTIPAVQIANTGGTVSQASQSIGGTGEAGTTIALTDNGQSISAPVNVGSNGYWSETITLANGANDLVAADTDAAGNAGGSNEVTYTLQTGQPPQVTEMLKYDTGASSTDDVTNKDTLTGGGAASTVVTLTESGVTLGTTHSNASGVWTFTPANLPQGVNTVVASETNSFGTGSASLTFTYDTIPPAVSIALVDDTGSSSTDKITSDPDLTGGGDPNATVTFTEGGATIGTTTANSAGAWVFDPTGLAQGKNTIVASETDLAGNTGTAPITFTYESIAPAVTEELKYDTGASSTDDVTNRDTLTGGGAADTLVTLTQNGVTLGTTTSNGAGVWSFTPTTLPQGVNTVVASETNLAGLTGTASLTFTYDTVPPAVTVALVDDTGSSGADKITGDPDLTGGGDAGATVAFTEGGATIGTTTANSAGVWVFDPTGLAQGKNTIVASETDLAGNTGKASITFTYDSVAPLVAITGAGGSVTAPSQTITGTGEAGTTVTLFDNGASIGGPVKVSGAGQWKETISLPALGANPIVADDVDVAGNIGVSNTDLLTLLSVPPTFTSGGGGASANYYVNPGATIVTSVAATDPDPGATVSYALLNSQGNPVAATGNFAINETTGALSLTGDPAAGSYSATVEALDNYGSTSKQAIDVTVAPSFFGGLIDVMSGAVGDAEVTDTFVFQPTSQPDVDVADNFRVTNTTSGGQVDPHGVLAFAAALFNGATAGESASQMDATLAANSTQIGSDTFINFNHGGVLLSNVNRVALLSHPGDFTFT